MTRILLFWLAIVGVVGCPSAHSAKAEARDPAPPGAEKAQGMAPAALPWLTVEEQGALGPVRWTRVEVSTDGKMTCALRQANLQQKQGERVLTSEQRTALENRLQEAGTRTAKPITRPGMIMDLGTTTLTLVEQGVVTTLVIDGTHDAQPAQAELLMMVRGLRQGCLEGQGP